MRAKPDTIMKKAARSKAQIAPIRIKIRRNRKEQDT